jgi:hypothetical protein
MAIRPELRVKGSVGCCQLNISDGVTANRIGSGRRSAASFFSVSGPCRDSLDICTAIHRWLAALPLLCRKRKQSQ